MICLKLFKLSKSSKGFQKLARACSASECKRIKESKSQRIKNYKEAKVLRFRLAETEHELVVRIPLEGGSRPIVAQPQTVAVACQLEDAREAVRVGDLLHAHVNPLI